MPEIDFKEKLNPEQYRVMREKDTERPFSGKYWDHDEGGIYTCAACGSILFSSLTKFDAENGWPCFTDAHGERSVDLIKSGKGTEVTCQHCHSHIGYLATKEGEQEEYYRVNSAALDFTVFPELPEEEEKDEDKEEKKKKPTQMTLQAFLALLASIVVGTGIGWAAGSSLCGSGIIAPDVSVSPTSTISPTPAKPVPSPTPTAPVTPRPTPITTTAAPANPASSSAGGTI
jgi:peptide-methionine (R)-S-oxide reductase